MILSIDFGGTRTRAALFAFEADGLTLLDRQETPSQVQDRQDVVIGRILALAKRVAGGASLKAIGVSAPGPLNPASGTIFHARTLPGWANVPLAAQISTAFDGTPTFVQNDANLAALAEYERGAGRGCDPMIYMTLSTGIGGGLVIGGRLFGGWSGLASEPGHQLITLPGGGLVRLEDVSSGTGLGAMARLRLSTTDQASVLRALDAAAVDGRAVGQAAEAGDPLALSVVEQAGEYLGIGICNLLHVISPQAVVIGGSVAQLGDLLLRRTRQIIETYILDRRFLPPDLIRPAQLGDDVCLIGAAYYALRAQDR
ncbi:MAG: ROK family protein [Anaerolineae bacterium]|nr:ROK family protein [Anaerolineae bacterium]